MEFTHVVVTAPTPAIARVYREMLDDLKQTSCAKVLESCSLWVVPDPIGARVGSGGGTLNALDHLDQAVGRDRAAALGAHAHHSLGRRLAARATALRVRQGLV